jgi:pimeloyl-ACP methyl ester carboxylesterase
MELGPTTIRGPQGRTLEVHAAGPSEGRVVLFHNGTPGAGVLFEPHVAEGAARGLRHVAYSRPGYGSSDRHRGRTVADCAADAAAVADALEIDRFLTVGWSGGGPHALACAALLPERTIAAAAIASVAPADAEGLDWLAGMAEENIDEFAAARAGEERLARYLQRAAAGLGQAKGAELHAELGSLLSAVDRAALTGEFAEYLAQSMRLAVSRGPWGWLDDDLACLAPWGVDLGEVQRPVTIWHGTEDRFVPFAHGEWLAEHVRGAQAMLLADEGHMSIGLSSYGRVLDGLLAAASRG